MKSVIKSWSRRRDRLFVVLFFFIGIGLVFLGMVMRFTPEVRAADPIILNGKLTDKQTGLPIANVKVPLYLKGEAKDNKGYWAGTTTDGDGNYRVRIDAASGTYYLNFGSIDLENDGIYDYPDQWHTANPDGYRDESHAVPITLVSGTNTVVTALEPYTTITIVGKLTDNQTRLPIANARMALDFYDANWRTWDNALMYGKPVTDANGNYRVIIKTVPPLTNPYYLYFSFIHIGEDNITYDYPDQWHTANPDGYRDKSNAVPITLVPGINTIETALEPYNAELNIEGTLTDNRTGLPITLARAFLSVYDEHRNYWNSQTITTDANGQYRLTFKTVSPVTGTYYLNFASMDVLNDNTLNYPDQWHTAGPNGSCDEKQAVPVTLVSGTNIITTALEPYTPLNIAGKLTDNRTGAPIANAHAIVRFYDENWRDAWSWKELQIITTDADGNYHLILNTIPHTSTYYLNFDAIDVGNDGIYEYPEQWHTAGPDGYRDKSNAIPVTLFAPGINTIKTALEPYHTITIAGKLTDNHTNLPIAHAHAILNLENEHRYDVWIEGKVITTDAHGDYHLTFDAPSPQKGTYYLKFSEIDIGSDGTYDYPFQYHTANPNDGYRDSEHAVPVTLDSGTNTITTALEPYTTLKGKLTDNRTGAPVANAHAILGLYDQYYRNLWREGEMITTDADGNYRVTFDVLLPRKSIYYLKFSAIDMGGDKIYEYPDQWHTANPNDKHDWNDPKFAVPITLTGGSNTVATTLEPYAAKLVISGKLIDNRTGLPVARTNMDMSIYDNNQNYRYGKPITTDADGNYQVTFGTVYTLTGTYYLYFSGIPSGYGDQWHTARPDSYSDWNDWSNAIPITLTSGTNRVTTTLEPHNTIVGTLTDKQTGKPLANAQMKVFIEDEKRNACFRFYCPWSYKQPITTDADGHYRLVIPLTRNGIYYMKFYDIDVEGDGIYDYPDQWHTANPDGYRDQGQAVPITLAPGPNTVETALEQYPTNGVFITVPDGTNSRKPVIAGIAEPGSTITITIDLGDGTSITFEVTADEGGHWCVDTGTATPIVGQMPEGGLTDGHYDIMAKKADTEGVTNPTARATLKVGQLLYLYLPLVRKS